MLNEKTKGGLLFLGGGSAAALASMLIGPLIEFFPSRRELDIQIQNQQIQSQKIEAALRDMKVEFKIELTSMKQDVIQRIDAKETRDAIYNQGMTNRVETLEASVFLKPRRSNN